MAREFFRNCRGSLTTTIAISAVPIVFAIGLAIDMGRISMEQAAFSGAVDSAALALAASPQGDMAGLSGAEKATRIAQLKQLAASYIDKNYSATSEGGQQIAISLDVTGTTITLSASHDYPTTIMAMTGITKTTLRAAAEVTKSGSSIEVALILDNTASMAGSRITSLKAAAKKFVGIAIWPSQTPYYSKVAIVPYTMGVNVGGTYATLARGSVTSGTSTTPGSANYRFKNTSNQNTTFAISDCVSERTGAQAYTDASVAAHNVGRNYPSPGNPCTTGTLLPLTSNKSALNAAIDSMAAAGSTAGQVGVAWGWYTLSPTFGLWSGASVPAAYGAPHVKKFAILMTDGEYNSPHCNGVIAKDATSGSGSSSDHINCNATNGDAYSQAQNLCTAMKQKGIIVYTIAFQLINTTAAQNLMTNCATDASHRYDAANEAQLQTVFQTIATNLLALRLSK